MLMVCYCVNQQMSMLSGSSKQSSFSVVIPKNVFSLIWALIFTCMTPNIDLLNVSMCSKMLYVSMFDTSYNLILSSKNVLGTYLNAWISFDNQLSSKLDLTVDLMFAVKDKVLRRFPFELMITSFFVTDTFVMKNIAVFVQGFISASRFFSIF